MKISIIVAIDENNGIGKNNNLLCYLPADLKNFKKTTSGNCIIMGRKTFESLPNGALPNRRNIVITRKNNFNAIGCEVANSIEDAMKLCNNENEVFVIGGANIYNQFVKLADLLYLTKIHKKFDADTFFPKINNNDWELLKQDDFLSDEKNKYPFSFLILKKK